MRIYKFLFFILLCFGFALAFGNEPVGDFLIANGEDTAENEADEETEEEEPEITSRIRASINRGLAYLATEQNGNGSYGGAYDIATTGLAGLAFIAGGHLPNRGEYSENVEKIVKHLMKNQSVDSGYFSHHNDHSRIHGHGYAGLFLAQILGMLTDIELQESVKSSVIKAVNLSCDKQTRDGGWGYVPDDQTFDEGSTTITQIQFLRAARDSGINVSRRKINNAIRYVYKCAMQTDYKGSDGKDHLGYTFKYSLSLNYNRSSYPLTAAAASVLQGTGVYEGEILEGALGWMRSFFNSYTRNSVNSTYINWFYYAQFYTSQAFWHSSRNEDWKKYYEKISDILISKQSSNGSWESTYGNTYATAISTMILAIPDRFLPLFQK